MKLSKLVVSGFLLCLALASIPMSAVAAQPPLGLARLLDEASPWEVVRIAPDLQLRAIALSGPNDGWAVGWAGSIAHLSAGTWTGATHVVAADLAAVALSGPNDGWAVGAAGTIAHLTAGGWSLSPSPTTNHLGAVALSGPDDGWAVGAGGAIIRLHNGEWTAAPSPVTQALYSVALAGPNDGWAVGDSGAILRLKDGVWNVAPSPATSKTLWSVALSGSDSGWIAAGDHFLRLQGETWVSIPTPLVQAFVTGIALSGPDDGWAISDVGVMARLRNGVWDSLPSPDSAAAIALYDANTGWTVNGSTGMRYSPSSISGRVTLDGAPLPNVTLYNGAQVVATTGEDGRYIVAALGSGESNVTPVRPGYTFTPASLRVTTPPSTTDADFAAVPAYTLAMPYLAAGVTVPFQNGCESALEPPSRWSVLMDVALSTSNEGWAVGYWEGIYRLIRLNDGQWQELEGLSDDTPTAIALSGPKDGWAAGASVWRLRNGVWTVAMPSLPGRVRSIALSGPEEGWAVSQEGYIFRIHEGAWTLYPLPFSAPNLFSVALSGPNDGWAVGGEGIMLKLTDGVWSEAPRFTAHLNAVALMGPNEGWAVGQAGTLLHLHDGAWSVAPSPTQATLSDIALTADGRGWAVGAKGTVLRLQDGVWTVVPSGSSSDLYAVAAQGRHYAWAVGRSILRCFGP